MNTLEEVRNKRMQDHLVASLVQVTVQQSKTTLTSPPKGGDFFVLSSSV